MERVKGPNGAQLRTIQSAQGHVRPVAETRDAGIPHALISVSDLLKDPDRLKAHLDAIKDPKKLHSELERISESPDTSQGNLLDLHYGNLEKLDRVFKEITDNHRTGLLKFLPFVAPNSVLGHSISMSNRVFTALDSKKSANAVDKEGVSLLGQAFMGCDYGEMDKLLKAGADPNFSFQENHRFSSRTLLDVAVGFDKPELLKILLENGAVADTPYNHDDTLVQLTIQYDSPKTLKFLFENGLASNDPSSVNHRDLSCMTLVQMAVVRNSSQCLHFLLENMEASIVPFPDNHQLYRGLSLVQAAVVSNSPKSLQILLDRGKKPGASFPANNKNYSGMTLAQVAFSKKFPEILTVLFKNGVLPETAFPRDNKTLGMLDLAKLAVSDNGPSLLKFLFKKGLVTLEASAETLVEAIVKKFSVEDSSEVLFANLAFLEAYLPHLKKEDIEKLLQEASPSGIAAAMLANALTGPLNSIAQTTPVQDKIDLSLLNSKGLFDIPEQISGLASAGETFFLEQRKKTLSLLMDDYENFKIGRDLPGHLRPENLATMLSVIRSIISSKIRLLSVTAKAELRLKITRFKTTASVAQFSGAVQSAHRLKIAGRGTEIAVLENLPKDGQSIAKNIQVIDSTKKGDLSHGFHVTGIVQQLAPSAFIRVGYTVGFKNLKLLLEVIRNANIINCSFGSIGHGETPFLLKKAISSGKLVVMASGNNGKSLDLNHDDFSRNEDQDFLTNLPAAQKGRLILTGNLEAGNVPAPSSNRPGTNEKLQDHFLWTLGSDVLSLTGPDKVEQMTGTSMSAPVVTGAAALVQSLCPKFTPEQVKECLLESADRDFWIHEPDISIHVVSPDKLSKLKVNAKGDEATWPFDKKIFGKGLLNVRRALEYANLKKGNPKLSPNAICQILDFKEQEAAKKIQTFFQKTRKNALPVKL